MVVDEAWRYLQDPAVLAYLAEAAKTWRKKNAALIVATQSAVDVTGTAGAEALLESMPTKLFLANPDLPDKADEIFRLNLSELNTIRSLIPQARAVFAPHRCGRASCAWKWTGPVIGSIPHPPWMRQSGRKRLKNTAWNRPLNTYQGGSCMLKFFPILAAALLSLPVLAQNAGAGASHHRGRGSDRADPGQDPAHHRDRLTRE